MDEKTIKLIINKLNIIEAKIDRIIIPKINFKKKKEKYPEDNIPTFINPKGKVEKISKELWYKLQK